MAECAGAWRRGAHGDITARYVSFSVLPLCYRKNMFVQLLVYVHIHTYIFTLCKHTYAYIYKPMHTDIAYVCHPHVNLSSQSLTLSSPPAYYQQHQYYQQVPALMFLARMFD